MVTRCGKCGEVSRNPCEACDCGWEHSIGFEVVPVAVSDAMTEIQEDADGPER
jgi:hypothetical protein